MGQFEIKYTEYTKDGTLTLKWHADFFSSALQAEMRYNELRQMYWLNDDGTTSTQRMYKVELMLMTYKKVSNPTEFLKQFHDEEATA